MQMLPFTSYASASVTHIVILQLTQGWFLPRLEDGKLIRAKCVGLQVGGVKAEAEFKA